ncbi:hypothetical protein FGO68_gene13088 [Halteria grandinella]|uniref:Uncharacterized protein n=1 Tax=Halteria grandinella TaxID=5974 RepID=A0A8J8NLG6_HALGN|nr:hypothetical protein FGO68_gene13088 [Halteria grandinella]
MKASQHQASKSLLTHLSHFNPTTKSPTNVTHQNHLQSQAESQNVADLQVNPGEGESNLHDALSVRDLKIKIHWLTLELKEKESLIEPLRENQSKLLEQNEQAKAYCRFYKNLCSEITERALDKSKENQGLVNEISQQRNKIIALEACIKEQGKELVSQKNQRAQDKSLVLK